MAEERKTVDAVLNEQKEQKSAKKNGAAPQKGKNASVESPKADKETEQEPLKLTRGQIFTLTTLLIYKYRFARILVNRDIDKEEVKKKIESIRAAKGVITPFLVLSAKECIEAGLDVVDYNGNVITKDTPDLEHILVILDGQHRWEAINELKKAGEDYEAYFILPLTDQYDLMTILKEANTSVNPWDGIDWLTMAIQTAKVRGLDTSKLEWLKSLANTENISDSAASLFVTGGKKIYSKATIKSAIDSKDPDKLETLVDEDGLDRNKNLYDAAIAKLNIKTVGLKITPKMLFSFVEQLINKNKPINDAYAHVIEFLNSLSKEQIESLDNAKKTTSRSKDQVITGLFKSYWKAFTERETLS